MERMMTEEEKIRRAEEIYARRHGQEISQSRIGLAPMNNRKEKDVRIFRKIAIKIAISLLIYLFFYIINNYTYIFSESFISQINKILNYDMNIEDIYNNSKTAIIEKVNQIKLKNQEINGLVTQQQDDTQESNQESYQENIQENEKQEEQEKKAEESEESNNGEETEEEKMIKKIKETTSFIKPIEGTISSKYGQREPTTATVPKNHTGTDIMASTGTKIKSATEGEVVLVSEEGDYGKHIKVQVGEVSIIYAHCNSIYIKQGEKVTQGQEIAEVGSTGNSTGPHLHFEIRLSEKTIDPEKILEL